MFGISGTVTFSVEPIVVTSFTSHTMLVVLPWMMTVISIT